MSRFQFRVLPAAAAILALPAPATAQMNMPGMSMPGMKMPMPAKKKPVAKKPVGSKAVAKSPTKKSTTKKGTARKVAPTKPRTGGAKTDPMAGHDIGAMPGMDMPAGHDMSKMGSEPTAKPADPMAGHDMTSMPGMEMPAGHDMKTMPGMELPAGHNMEAMPGMDMSAGHDMSGKTSAPPSGTDLPAGNAPPPTIPAEHAADAVYGAEAMHMGRHHLTEFHGNQKLSQVPRNL